MSTQLQDFNSGIAGQFRIMAETGRLLHAVIFYGGSSESRMKLALSLQGILIPGHPEDFIPVSKSQDKASVGTEDVESLQDRLRYKPYGERYLVVIDDAHLMGPAAQNKLLKTLEEPVSEAVIILLAEQLESLLPTVLSRCSSFHLEDEAQPEDDDIAAAADSMLALVKGGAPFYKKKAAISAILGEKEDLRSRALAFLDAFEKRLLAEASGEPTAQIMDAQRALCEARSSIRQLHNASYTLKQMCLRI